MSVILESDVQELNKNLMPGAYEEDDDGDLSALDRGDSLEPAEEKVDEPETEVEEPVEEAEAEPEAEPEVEPEVEEPEEEVAEEEEAPKPKKIMIPKSRLDDEIAKRRKLETDLAELQKQHKQVETTKEQDEAFATATKEANALLRQANEAVLDGELDKAAELQQQALVKMNVANQTTHAPDVDPEAIYAQIEAKLELKHTIKDIYEKYPEFNHEGDQADGEMIERAIMYEKMYAEMGHTPSEAVRRAVEDTLKVLAPEKLVEKPVSKKPSREQDKRSNLKTKVEAANKVPPVPKTSNSEEPAIDIATLTEDDFDALPESVKARLRGDFG